MGQAQPASGSCCFAFSVGWPKRRTVAIREAIRRGGYATVSNRYSTTTKLEDDYVTVQGRLGVVGVGACGEVRLANARSDGRKCAVKTLPKQGLNRTCQEALRTEAVVHLVLDHPHVVRLLGVYETSTEVHLVMEHLAGGELLGRVKQRRYTESAAVIALGQMLSAVQYLHQQRVVHRDVKLDNFIYERLFENHLKLVDFGLAAFLDRRPMTLVCGTPEYMAPEVLAGSYTETCDLWSLGICAYILLTGDHLFNGTVGLTSEKKDSGFRFNKCFHQLSCDAQDFIRSLLVFDPAERPTTDTALKHVWFQPGKGSNGVEQLLPHGGAVSARIYQPGSMFL